jgi:hypothetical protein
MDQVRVAETVEKVGCMTEKNGRVRGRCKRVETKEMGANGW